MVKIAICDDEVRVGAELEAALTAIFAKLNIVPEIRVFTTGEALCKEINAGISFSLIFLDIEFAQNQINGVEVGRRIRENYQNQTTAIVFISWEKKYAMELFDIRPINFLIKPLEYEKLEQVIHTYFKLIRMGMKEFIYKKNTSTYRVPLQQLVYLENDKRKVILHFSDGKTDAFYGSLKEIYDEQLKDADFLFIHASYLVNYDYVAVLEYNQVSLIGRKLPLPISPNRRNDVRKDYLTIIQKRRT